MAVDKIKTEEMAMERVKARDEESEIFFVNWLERSKTGHSIRVEELRKSQ